MKYKGMTTEINEATKDETRTIEIPQRRFMCREELLKENLSVHVLPVLAIVIHEYSKESFVEMDIHDNDYFSTKEYLDDANVEAKADPVILGSFFDLLPNIAEVITDSRIFGSRASFVTRTDHMLFGKSMLKYISYSWKLSFEEVNGLEDPDVRDANVYTHAVSIIYVLTSLLNPKDLLFLLDNCNRLPRLQTSKFEEATGINHLEKFVASDLVMECFSMLIGLSVFGGDYLYILKLCLFTGVEDPSNLTASDVFVALEDILVIQHTYKDLLKRILENVSGCTIERNNLLMSAVVPMRVRGCIPHGPNIHKITPRQFKRARIIAGIIKEYKNSWEFNCRMLQGDLPKNHSKLFKSNDEYLEISPYVERWVLDSNYPKEYCECRIILEPC